MTSEYRILRKFGHLSFERVQMYSCWGYRCEITGCFVNDDMVKYFDGFTERCFTELEYNKVTKYTHQCDGWRFNSAWFEESYLFTEEDFAL